MKTTKPTDKTRIPELEDMPEDIRRVFDGEQYAKKAHQLIDEGKVDKAIWHTFETGFAEGVLFVTQIMENQRNQYRRMRNN